jgi:hypothetical protein
MNRASPSATLENGLKSARYREINRAPVQVPTSVLPNSASRGKPALLSAPLKRKLVEVSPFTFRFFISINFDEC